MSKDERIARLELENNYLKLQLNIIFEQAMKNDIDPYVALGHILSYSDSRNCVSDLKFIQRHGLDYNYRFEMRNVDNWEVSK